MSTLIICIILVLVVGIPLYVIGVTFLGLGTYGVFAGEKSYFRGVASTKYTSNKIEVKEGRNLNGKLVKTLKVKNDTSYTIKFNVENISGDVKVTIKDRNKNIIGITNESIVEGIPYYSEKNAKLIVIMEFTKFSGQVICEL